MTHAQGQEIKDLLTAGSATQADAGICAIM